MYCEGWGENQRIKNLIFDLDPRPHPPVEIWFPHAYDAVQNVHMLYLPVGDAEFDGEANDERENGADETRLELRDDDGVDERVRAVPEEKHERCEQEVVERRVDDRELGARLHLADVCAATHSVFKLSRVAGPLAARRGGQMCCPFLGNWRAV